MKVYVLVYMQGYIDPDETVHSIYKNKIDAESSLNSINEGDEHLWEIVEKELIE